MLRRSPRALLLWLAAVLVAVTTTVVVGETLSSLRRQDRELGRVHDLLVAARDLAVGTRLGPGDVRLARVRGRLPEHGVLPHASDAVGRVVRVRLLAGALVLDRALTTRRRDGRDGIVPPGRRAMRVVVPAALHPEAGDAVDLYVTFDPRNLAPDAEPTLTVARGVEVVAVDGRADTPTDDPARRTPAGGDALGITVLVTPEQALRLAYSQAVGTLALALTPPEDAAR